MPDEYSAFTLRALRADEIESLRQIDSDARARYSTLSGFEKLATAPAIAAERFTNGETIVAIVGGAPAGYILMQPLDGLLYIANIAVASRAAGIGIGAALLQSAERHACSLNLPAIVLTTFRVPRWNGPWFRKHGFAPYPADETGPGLQAILDRHASFLDMSTREVLRKRL